MTASIYDIPFNCADGSTISLGEYADEVPLIVNVASEIQEFCRLTYGVEFRCSPRPR